jgi:MFS family permease
MLRRFLGENGIGKRGFIVITILFVSVFGWYYMTLPIMEGILSNIEITHTENIAIWATFYVSIIGTSILGAFLSNKIDRLKFLYAWTVFGVVVSLLPVTLTNVTLLQVWSISLLLGASFGLGLPSCLAYFAECTVVENRGRIGGTTFLIANISGPFLAILFGKTDLATMSVVFTLLRGMALIVFFLKPKKQSSSQMTTNASFVSILRDKTFLLYFVAWFMFSLVNRFEIALLEQFLTGWMPSLLEIMTIVEPLVACLSILIGGLLCDWIGRKKIILSGFVALGVAYAIIGLDPRSVIFWYLYFVVDGVAWGIFLLTFVLILWGDLSQPETREKYYALGSVPFFLSYIIPELLTESFVEQISLFAAFSLASFFLFIAVLPLLFAPETLPEKKMELRRLRSFAEDAKKAREKYERKMEKD